MLGMWILLWWAMLISGIALIAGVVWYFFRLSHLAGCLGSFECSYRPGAGQKWQSGIGVFGGTAVAWHRPFAWTFRPTIRWERAGMDIVMVRPAGGGRESTFVTIEFMYEGTSQQIAVHRATYSALVAWLESAPPLPRHFT